MINRCFITIATLIFLALPLFAEEGHQHGENDHDSPIKSEPKHEMSSHGMHQDGSKTDVKPDYDYIRVDTPAGYNAVIGRKNPLPTLKPEIIVEKGEKIKVFTLTAENVKFEIFPGKFIDGWGFNGMIPGPTMRVNEGDRIRVLLKNNTDEKHTIHIHGQKKPVIADGVPYLGQKPVEKGESYAFDFIVQNTGT
ncbi:MAG: multicopper oxidase domain-containing protein, partial [Thermodesulfovibrionales bacterium]